jgi:predicted GNAT family acetyltransferase
MASMAEVIDVPERSRYEIRLDGQRIGFLDYYRTGDTMTIPHTEIEPAFGGRGLGAELVHEALDDIRSRQLLVRPLCSFVRHYISQHPEYADMVEGA